MTRWTTWIVALGLAVGMMLGATPARAATLGGSYTPGDKLVRGLGNFFLGFLEIPRNIHNTTDSSGMLSGWTVGLGKGLGYTVLRMGAGLYDAVTFPFPVPHDYAPIIEPEYPWQAPGPSLTPAN